MTWEGVAREELERRLEEAESTLQAIRTGQVDAVIVHGGDGERVFSLRSSESAYRILIESMSEAALWLSEKGLIVYANARLGRMLGKTLEGIIGRPFEDLVPPPERERLRIALGTPGETVRAEFGLVTGPGTTMPVLLSIRPFRDEGERAFAVVATDLSVQKRVEQTLAKQAADLETANRELETFNYSVSHDLRNPLTVLRGGISLILEDPTPETVAEFGPEIKACAERMSQIIHSLLALSRMSRAEVERKPVDLSALARQVASRFVSLEPSRPVEVIVQPGLRDEADPGLLLIVLENLFHNAFKFTRPQSRPRIEFGQTESEGGLAYFVRDNGVGFDMQLAGRLFEPFHRLHQRDQFDGNGIGLATVARILRRHGGRIWASAKPGEGACFCFTLRPISAYSTSMSAPPQLVGQRATAPGQPTSAALQH